MEKEIAKYLLKKLIEKGSDDVVISYVSSEAKQIKFVNNEIVKTGTEYLRSLNVFASLKKRLISTTLKDITKKSADNLVDNILNFSKNIRAKDDYYGIAKGPFKYKKIEDLYVTGKSTKLKLHKKVVYSFFEVVAILEAAINIYDLWKQPSLNFEKLINTENRYSVRLDRKWRLELTIDWQDEKMIVGIIGIEDITNHYGG